MSWRSFLSLRKYCTTNPKTAIKSLDFSQMPGPRYYPILGSLNDIITFGKNERLHLTVDEMHKKYGNIFRARIDVIDAVFLSSADYTRSMFAYEGKYPKHPIPPAWLYFNEKFRIQRGLLFMDDKEWLEHRQILNEFLLRDFKWTEQLIEMTCDSFTSKIKRMSDSEDAHTVDNLEDELYLWSAYTILNLMLGSSTSEQSDRKFDAKVWEFVTIAKKIFETSSKLMSISPKLADKFQMSAYREFEDAAQRSISISRSLISILSNEMQSSENGLLRKMRSQHLNDDMIVRLFSDLIIAAGDTTVHTVLWILHSIAKDKNLYNRIKQDIVNNPNTSEPPLVRGCARESMRLYPVAPFVGRFIDRNAEIGGYFVPKGTLVLSSLYTTSRDPLNFSDPLKFIPDRWLRDEKGEHKEVLNPHATIPFSMGSRSCIGKKVALYQIHCLVTKILQQFSLESENKDDVNFKLKLIGVPDKKILIAFRRAMP